MRYYFYITTVKSTVKFGTENISYRETQIWNLILDNIKSESTLEQFKRKIRKWRCGRYPRMMCKNVLQHVDCIS